MNAPQLFSVGTHPSGRNSHHAFRVYANQPVRISICSMLRDGDTFGEGLTFPFVTAQAQPLVHTAEELLRGEFPVCGLCRTILHVYQRGRL